MIGLGQNKYFRKTKKGFHYHKRQELNEEEKNGVPFISNYTN